MSNDFLGQILGSVLGGGEAGNPGAGKSFGSAGGLGGLGAILGGMMGSQHRQDNGGAMGESGGLGGLGGMGGFGGTGDPGQADGGSLFGGGKGAALTALLIPLAMQWVQRNGGIGGVLERFQQKGYNQQAQSWVSTGDNEALPPEAIDEVVGNDELSRLSQQLGVSREEVSGGMAEVLPEVVNQLTPHGQVSQDSDERLSRGISAFDEFFKTSQSR